MFEGLENIIFAFYRWLLKLTINAHQVFAYCRTRIRKEQRGTQQTDTLATSTNVELTNHVGEQTSATDFGPNEFSVESIQVTEINNNNNNQYNPSGHHFNGPEAIKTPHTRRSKLTSLFRRLSLRNFMEYCAIALNEASNSGCSNRFDLSSCNGTVWLIGRQYNLPTDEEKLTNDIRTKLWITYRKNFPPIDENTRYTTDRGFGCMIRCGQMVLANALLYKNLGRDWNWSARGLETNPEVYKKILKLFQDREDCLYSIHRIVQNGQHEGKSVGEWFGPNTIAQALKRMSSTYFTDNHDKIDSEILISIDAALDNIVVIDEIKSKFKQQQQQQQVGLGSNENGSGDKHETISNQEANDAKWIPGILFIQLRLGLTKINPLYFAALKKTFQFKNSLGIIGGRPNHALYLVGYTDDDIIYLDPHSTQQYIDFDEISKTPSNLDTTSEEQQQQHQETIIGNSETADQSSTFQPIDVTYHCSCPEKMPIDRLDPSLALCFYFSSEVEFDDWCSSSQELLIKSEQAPMFEITKSRPTDWNISLTSLELDYVMQ